MKGKYYKPTGAAMTSAIDWLLLRKQVRVEWNKFLEDNAMQDGDLLVEDGKVVGVLYYPAFGNEEDIDTVWPRLPAMPSTKALGALLGVEDAKALTITGRGTIVLVMDEKGLPDHTELTPEELKTKYNIKYHTKDCPNCGLWLSNEETRCHRCGEKVKDD